MREGLKLLTEFGVHLRPDNSAMPAEYIRATYKLKYYILKVLLPFSPPKKRLFIKRVPPDVQVQHEREVLCVNHGACRSNPSWVGGQAK